MTLREQCDRAAAYAKSFKDSRVSDPPEDGGRPEVPCIIHGWRGSESVATLIPFQVDRDAGLQAAQLAAGGFGCDVLAMSMDAWSATTRDNPVTGRPWRPREMQDVMENHQGIERGWITEGVSTYAVNRAGDLSGTAQHYKLSKFTNPLTGRGQWRIEWQKPVQLGWGAGGKLRKARSAGVVTDALVAYMNSPTLQQWVARFGVDPREFGVETDEEAQAHLDCGVVRAFRLSGWAGAVILDRGEPGGVRHEIITRSLGHLGYAPPG